MITCTRFHDFSCGHRVVGHEGKCVGLHGHNYRIHFEAAANRELDSIGRVVDFSVLKSTMCQWLEDNWDHKMLLWERDPIAQGFKNSPWTEVAASIVLVPFNPTAENMARCLLNSIGPALLSTSRIYLRKVIVEETRKCSAMASID